MVCDGTVDCAPDLMSGGEVSCFFKSQPKTPEQLDRALMAMENSCVAALRYRGTDWAIIERLVKAGLADCCDVLKYPDAYPR